MIPDFFLGVVATILDALSNALPAAGSHSWLTDAGPDALAVVTGAFAWDDVLPLHESLIAVGVLAAISVPSLAWKIAVAIYRLVPFKGT